MTELYLVGIGGIHHIRGDRMIEVFDEKLVDECLSEVADSDIKTYAYCL